MVKDREEKSIGSMYLLLHWFVLLFIFKTHSYLLHMDGWPKSNLSLRETAILLWRGSWTYLLDLDRPGDQAHHKFPSPGWSLGVHLSFLAATERENNSSGQEPSGCILYLVTQCYKFFIHDSFSLQKPPCNFSHSSGGCMVLGAKEKLNRKHLACLA